MKPLLFVDVDGVLNPQLSGSQARKLGFTRRHVRYAGRREGVWINPEHGPMLLAMADTFDLVWATWWMHAANREIGPMLGLPTLPVAEFTDADGLSKVPGVLRYAAGRPFAWLDDDLSSDELLAVRRHPDHLVALVDDTVGLTETHLVTVRRWWGSRQNVA